MFKSLRVFLIFFPLFSPLLHPPARAEFKFLSCLADRIITALKAQFSAGIMQSCTVIGKLLKSVSSHFQVDTVADM